MKVNVSLIIIAVYSKTRELYTSEPDFTFLSNGN